jgi:diguanylate cyclase (GGDEF)-like protein
MRILIADDDLTSRMLLAGVLRRHGYEVVETLDGIAALAAMQGPDAPRLAILDWVMPGLDGLQVVEQLRARPTERPPYLIMLTARGGKADLIRGLDSGANDYLAKPFDPGELRARIEVGRRMVEIQDALLESRATLAHQASHDMLTGLLNRRAILEAVDAALGQAPAAGCGWYLAMIDIDRFKRINDAHGHQVGDEVLTGLATLLRAAAPTLGAEAAEAVRIGRLGGEEFLLLCLLPISLDLQALHEHFDALCRQVAATPQDTRVGPIPITISIGVSRACEGRNADTLLANADRALYAAKGTGRNRVVVDL